MSALLDTLLDAQRRAECARHDAPRDTQDTETPRRRRADPPRPSRFGDLT